MESVFHIGWESKIQIGFAGNERGCKEKEGGDCMFLDFVRTYIGTVGSDCDFVLVVTACVLLLTVCGLILSFFLGALSCLTTRFFKS